MRSDYQKMLRDVSAASTLNETAEIIVRGVKDVMPFDACAVYLADSESDQQVLAASAGLNLRPTDQTSFDRHTGLLGLVDECRGLVTLTSATTNAGYCPPPGAGDKSFETFIGMPLTHLQRVLGILAGWKVESRAFDSNELTFFVTIATRLASIVHDAASTDEVACMLSGEMPERAFLRGIRAAPGLALGRARVLKTPVKSQILPERYSLDVETEEKVFRAAVAAVRQEFEAGGEQLSGARSTEVRNVFRAYVMLLEDEALFTNTIERIRAVEWASKAWRATIEHHAAVFDQIEDIYLRARAEDIREIGQRVLLRLESEFWDSTSYPEQCILVADRVGITDMAAVPAGQLVGIVSRYGSALSHASVFARALGIPAVVSLSLLSSDLIEGCEIAVDGDRGQVYVKPSSTMVKGFERTIREQRLREKDLSRLRDLPARTADGVTVPLHANIGLPSDVDAALGGAAEGVGLFRTEYQYLRCEGFPAEEEQYLSYVQVLRAFAPKPVTIRTLDVGGDKILSYFPVVEDNPFLGCRGIRFSLAHPEIFLIQLRALLRANGTLGNLNVMLPMVSRVLEVETALGLLQRAHRELLEEGKASAIPGVGIMVEVPSAMFLVKNFADRVDFFSIGSNDLAQYILAADRTNPEVAGPDDTLHPAVLDAIRLFTINAHEQTKLVSVCGEMAGDPAGALALIGLGIDVLSMNPAALAPVKLAIRAFTVERARSLAKEALRLEDGQAVRNLLSCALHEAGVLLNEAD